MITEGQESRHPHQGQRRLPTEHVFMAEPLMIVLQLGGLIHPPLEMEESVPLQAS